MRRLSRWLLSRPLFRVPVRQQSVRKPVRLQPRVEHLEDRVVPVGGIGRPLPFPTIFAGSGFGSETRVQVIDADTGSVNFVVNPYEERFTGGVNVAAADLNNDGFPDLITGTGIDGGPRVRSFDGKTGEPLQIPLGNFWAFEQNFTGGVNVAAGDVTGDGVADIVVAAAWGGGPRVRAFDGTTGESVADFWAFEESFTGGVNVAVADLTLDQRGEIIVGAGAGGGSRVVAFDLKSGQPEVARGFHTNFMADDTEARDGAVVTVADVNGDQVPDVIAAPAAGGLPRVKVFNGFDGSLMSDFLAFGPEETGGVRVSTFYLTEDGYADIVVASATGNIRIFNAGTGQLVTGPASDFAPFEALSGRVNVAAANDPGTQKVSLVTTIDSLSGTLASGQGFGVTLTAIPFSKAVVPTGTVTLYIQEVAPGTGNVIPIASGTLAANGVGYQAAAEIAMNEHALEPGTYELWGTYGGDATFNVPFNVEVALIEIGVSHPAPLPECECPETAASVQQSPAGSSLGAPSGTGDGGIRVADGSIAITRDDFDGATIGGSGFSQTWGWTNSPAYGDAEAGSGGGLMQSPNLTQVSGDGSIAAITGTNSALFFDYYFGEYHSRFNDQTSLALAGGQFTLIDGVGNSWVFYDFSGGTPSGREGRMISATTADGTTTSVTSWDGSGRPEEMQRVTGAGGSAVTESLLNAYIASGANAGLIESTTLRRKVGSGSWETVRVAEYTYYVDADNHGRDRHLKLAAVKDGSSNVLSTDYYRYDVSASGTDKPIKFAFGQKAYAQLVAALGSSVDSLSDVQVDEYADHYLEYDGSKRITKHIAAGAGCSICTGGQGEYTYSYATNVVMGVTIQGGPNTWRKKVTETLPDGNQNIVYLNGTGQVMLKVHKNVTTNDQWRWYTQYDKVGRAVYSAGPSNVTSHDEQYADLVNNQGGNYQYLDDDDGLVMVSTYASSTTATTSTPGDVDGFLSSTAIRQGESGTDLPQSDMTYILRNDGSQDFTFPATSTQYRNDNGTGGQTTTWAYTWLSGTATVESVTTTLPTVTTTQNGPNTATSMTTVQR